MFRGIHRQLLTSVWMLAMLVGTAAICFGNYSGGTGDPNDPYQIANATDLLTLAADVNDYNKCFILTADIDLDPNLPGGQVFTTAIIGSSFTGTFDGNDHKITNLTIDDGNNSYLGLFRSVNSPSLIKNLDLENFTVNGHEFIGGLVGYNWGSIDNCYATGTVSGFIHVGGLVGENFGTISNCYCHSTGNVNDGYVGGLVGQNVGGSNISNCYSAGDVNGNYNVGGLVGNNIGGAAIRNCYSTSTVSGSDRVGGLVGYNTGSIISNSYFTGIASGAYRVGGLVGFCTGSSISSCYFLITSGPANGYGTPLTDTQMKQQVNFTGWDFTTIWAICEGTNYPRLRWQIPAADLVCPDGVNFVDYSFFAVRWLNTGCASKDNCDNTDFDFSGTVDIADLRVFCNHWLEGL